MKALAFVLGIALVTAGCGHRIVRMGHTMPGEYTMALFEYPLATCPDDQFALPALTQSKDTRMVAGYFDGPYCHGFTKYALESKQALSFHDIVPIYVWLQREENGCRLFIGMPNERSDTAAELGPHAERAARLILGKINTSLVSNPKLEIFETHRAFKDWCEKRAVDQLNRSSHKIFQHAYHP